MVVRTLSSLLIVLCVLIAAHLARPITFAGVQLGEGVEVIDVDGLSENANIEVGDRIIAVNGRPYRGGDVLAKRVSPLDGKADVRVASLNNLRRETLRASQLHQELPDILQPTNYLLSIDGKPAYGESGSTVARVLQDYEQVTVVAVPTENIQDQVVALKRGWPPLMAMIAGVVALLALFILWGGAPLLGVTLGLAAAGAALWLDVAYPVARIVGLGVLCLAAASAAWMFIQNTTGERGRKAAFEYEGGDAASNLRLALQRAESQIGAPLYIIVGSAKEAVEIKRSNGQLSMTAADAILVAVLSMLATEGGVFPRVDVGEDVRDPWDDPLQDLDLSANIAAAVPFRDYGGTPDRWAFVIARTTDTPSSTAILTHVAETVDEWETSGVRAFITTQVAEGEITDVPTPQSESVPTDTSSRSSGAPSLVASTVSNPEFPLSESLDNVSEGVGIPRVVTRAELAQRDESAQPHPANEASLRPAPEVASSPLQQPDLANKSEGIGVPRVITRAEYERSAARPTSGDAVQEAAYIQSSEEPAQAATSTIVAKGVRAWAGHLARRLHGKYPVDDPRYYNADDWARLAPAIGSDAPALFYGEAGVGKEFAARAVLERSARADAPVAVIDCADLPESAVELELFGLKDDPGVLSGITGGALILKSPLTLSSAMLRDVIDKLRESNVRLFLIERQPGQTLALSSSAAGELLKEHVRERVIRIPPLRERPQDILRAAELILEHFATLYAGGRRRELTPAAIRLLESMELPANYWELESLMRSAVLRTDEDMIDVQSLTVTYGGDVSEDLSSMSQEEERAQLVDVLHRSDGNKEDAARMVGLTVDALLRRLKRHGLV